MKIILASLAAAALLAGCSSMKAKKTMGAKPVATMKAAKTAKHSMTKSGTSTMTLTCSKGKDKRVATVALSKDRCIVEYTKWGKTKEIASGGPKSHHCADVQNEIRKNLTKAGFKCE